ncbi:MAG: sensor histidine kinase [Lautropia sp.]
MADPGAGRASPAGRVGSSPRAQPSRASHRSLRSRLLSRLLPPLLLLFGLSAGLSYFGARYYADQVLDRWLADTAEALAQRITLIRGRVTLDLPEAARQIVQWDAADTTWFEVRGDRSGHIAGHPAIPPPPPGELGRLRGTKLYSGSMLGAPVRIASYAVTPPEGAEEVIEVRVAETVRKRQALAAELLLSVLLPQLLLVVVAGVVVWFTLRKLLAPIGSVAEALEAQTHHSLEPVDDRALPSEVVPLTHAVNALLLRLKDALAAQRHFIADAAHQLRTPLTALKLHADEAARETDPVRLAPVIREVQQAADRAVRLSNQLLTLARAEPSARIAEPHPFALREVVFEAAGRWVPAALRAGIDLGFDAAPAAAALVVAGDPALFAEAIHNVIDNALKYCPRGTRITVAVEPAGPGQARIDIDDDGPGIPAADRAHVLQRFHRAGAVAADRSAGLGLGLAIVAEIVRGHGGEVRIEDGAGGRGTRVAIVLPTA